MNNIDDKKTYTVINLAKFICALMVIELHTIASINELSISYVITLISRIAVPFFFICNGYFLCNKLYSDDMQMRKKYIFHVN